MIDAPKIMTLKRYKDYFMPMHEEDESMFQHCSGGALALTKTELKRWGSVCSAHGIVLAVPDG